MPARQPEGPPPPPVVQRLRLCYAKRGRMRFASHRDLARSLERGVRRAGVPLAYSAGFTAHPRISYAGAAPTGAASEAEYAELGLAEPRSPEQVAEALDAALPDGLRVVRVVPAPPGSPALGDLLEASRWQVELPGPTPAELAAAVAALLAAEEVTVSRSTKTGRRDIPLAPALVSCTVREGERAILDLVVRHTTPAVRPDDVLAGLAAVASLAPTGPAVAVRLAQGPLLPGGLVGDPLAWGVEKPDDGVTDRLAHPAPG